MMENEAHTKGLNESQKTVRFIIPPHLFQSCLNPSLSKVMESSEKKTFKLILFYDRKRRVLNEMTFIYSLKH